jgi:hypothetical protein
MRLGGPQSRSGQYGKVTILYPKEALNSDPFVIQPVGSTYTDYATVKHFSIFCNCRLAILFTEAVTVKIVDNIVNKSAPGSAGRECQGFSVFSPIFSVASV